MANIEKRGDSYRITVSNGYDSNGKQIIFRSTFKPAPNLSKKEIEKQVKEYADKFEQKCKYGYYAPAITVKEFVETSYLPFVKDNRKKSYYVRQKQLSERVIEKLGHIRLDRLTDLDVDRFIQDLHKNGKSKQGDKPLSRKTIKHHLSFISSAYQYAISKHMVDYNPCSNVCVPKMDQAEKEIYTVEEVKQIIDLLETAPIKYRVFFMLAIYTGFRRGELLGLEWKDIDWDYNIIRVCRTSNYNHEDGIYTDTTKTKSSNRYSSRLPDNIMDLLKSLQEEQEHLHEANGDRWIESDRLFVQNNGSPMGTSTPYTWLERTTKKHGIRFCDIHSIRHFFASELILNGIDVVRVSAALGHSSITTTQSTYLHVIKEAEARHSSELTEKITAALGLEDKENTNKKESPEDGKQRPEST